MSRKPSESTEACDVIEFCRRHGISRDTFYKEVRSGRLRARKLGKKTIVTRGDAAQWLDGLPALELRASA